MKTKMITIDHRGYINTSRGRIFGPIVNKYRESIDLIWPMVATGMRVYEHFNDGSTLLLTTSNFDRNNTPKVVNPSKPPVVTKVVDPAIPVDKKTELEEKTEKERKINGPSEEESVKGSDNVISETETKSVVERTSETSEQSQQVSNRQLSRRERREMRNKMNNQANNQNKQSDDSVEVV